MRQWHASIKFMARNNGIFTIVNGQPFGDREHDNTNYDTVSDALLEIARAEKRRENLAGELLELMDKTVNLTIKTAGLGSMKFLYDDDVLRLLMEENDHCLTSVHTIDDKEYRIYIAVHGMHSDNPRVNTYACSMDENGRVQKYDSAQHRWRDLEPELHDMIESAKPSEQDLITEISDATALPPYFFNKDALRSVLDGNKLLISLYEKNPDVYDYAVSAKERNVEEQDIQCFIVPKNSSRLGAFVAQGADSLYLLRGLDDEDDLNAIRQMDSDLRQYSDSYKDAIAREKTDAWKDEGIHAFGFAFTTGDVDEMDRCLNTIWNHFTPDNVYTFTLPISDKVFLESINPYGTIQVVIHDRDEDVINELEQREIEKVTKYFYMDDAEEET